MPSAGAEAPAGSEGARLWMSSRFHLRVVEDSNAESDCDGDAGAEGGGGGPAETSVSDGCSGRGCAWATTPPI
eukprot:8124112-Lingulodinium_polyedra.AAC.1